MRYNILIALVSLFGENFSVGLLPKAFLSVIVTGIFASPIMYFSKWKVILLKQLLLLLLSNVAVIALAHPSPNSLVFLDVSPGRVAMEIQMPVPELELAIPQPIADHPAAAVEQFGPQLRDYLLAHIHAYVNPQHPWQVMVNSLEMSKGKYVGTNVDYWEVVAHLTLLPNPGESTRKFTMDYDVIMHQVVTHSALLSLRSDWETGTHTAEEAFTKPDAEAGVIRKSLSDDKVHPVEINLETGSRWKGFKSMFGLGMQHIREGTDHLLFLLVLLLPSMLLLKGTQWNGFGGIKYSSRHLLQIVTAFTIGHSVTLFIGAAGWLKLPAQPVEVAIAFSIFVSAVHALYPLFPGKEMYVAAGFGLVHGLAFATVLSNMNLGASTLALSILGFNLGIEAAQLVIVLLIVPWLMMLSTTPAYKWIRIAGALLAAIAALAWVAERSTGQPNVFTRSVAILTTSGWWMMAGWMAVSLAVFGWYRYRAKANISREQSDGPLQSGSYL